MKSTPSPARRWRFVERRLASTKDTFSHVVRWRLAPFRFAPAKLEPSRIAWSQLEPEPSIFLNEELVRLALRKRARDSSASSNEALAPWARSNEAPSSFAAPKSAPSKRAAREVGVDPFEATEPSALPRALGEDRTSRARCDEARPRALRAREVGAFQERVVEARPAHEGAAEVGARQIGAKEERFGEIGVAELGVREPNVREHRALKLGVTEIDAGELRAAEVDPGEIGACEREIPERGAPAELLEDDGSQPRGRLRCAAGTGDGGGRGAAAIAGAGDRAEQWRVRSARSAADSVPARRPAPARRTQPARSPASGTRVSSLPSGAITGARSAASRHGGVAAGAPRLRAFPGLAKGNGASASRHRFGDAHRHGPIRLVLDRLRAPWPGAASGSASSGLVAIGVRELRREALAASLPALRIEPGLPGPQGRPAGKAPPCHDRAR